MENKDKLRVLLQHWIEHNTGHSEEFEKWRKTAEDEGESNIAAHIGEAIKEMADANSALEKALQEAGGKADSEGHHHHHHHHHDHNHEH